MGDEELLLLQQEQPRKKRRLDDKHEEIAFVIGKRKLIERLRDLERPEIPDGVFESSAANYQLIDEKLQSFGCTQDEVRKALQAIPSADAPRTFAATRYTVGSRSDNIPDTAVLFFSSTGQIIQTGNVSDEVMTRAIEYNCKFLSSLLQHDFVVTQKRMLNMVSNMRLSTGIELGSVAQKIEDINEQCDTSEDFQRRALEPEERYIATTTHPLIAENADFPALRIKRNMHYNDENRALERQVFIINKNGSITCTGFRSQESLLLGRRWIYDLCMNKRDTAIITASSAIQTKKRDMTLQQQHIRQLPTAAASTYYNLRLEEYFDSI